MRNVVFIIVLASCFVPLGWGRPPGIVNYTADNGLINNTVYYVMQDRKGFIWFCTESGVTRFDGTNWDNFTLDEGLADNENFKCYEDSKHRIWFLSLNGKFCYFLKGKIHSVSLDKSLHQQEVGMLFDCVEDRKNKRIYFLTSKRRLYFFDEEKGVIRLNAGKQNHYLLSRYKNEIYSFRNGGPNNDLQAICLSDPGKRKEYFRFPPASVHQADNYYINNGNPIEGAKNNILYINSSGVFEANRGVIKPYVLYRNFPRTNTFVFLYKLNDDIYMGGAGGLFKIKNGVSTGKPQPQLFFPAILANNLIQDKSGNFWIATYNKGVYFLPENRSDSKSIILSEKEGNQETYCVFKNDNGQLLIGLLNSTCATFELKNSNIDVRNLSKNSMDKINRIKHIFAKNGRTYFIGDNLFLVENARSKTKLFQCNNYFNTLKSYCFDSKGTAVWLISSQFIQRYDVKKNTVTDSIYFPKRSTSIALSDKDELYVGTAQGLYVRKKNGQFYSMNSISPLFEAGVTGLISDQDKLWIATHGCGIVLLQNGKVKQVINKKKGLISNVCNRIVSDAKAFIYVCTSSGLSVVNKNSFQVTNLTVADGLISNVARDVCIEKQKKIYIATDKGISVLSWPKAQKPVDPPQPYLRIFQVNDSIFSSVEKQFHYTYTPSSLSLQYAAITYFAPKSVTYRYRLKEDDKWQSNSSGNITFYNLSPGRYNIEVQARQYKSGWSKSLRIQVHVQPLWYQKTAVKFLTVLLLLMICVVLVYWRIRQLRKRDSERHQVEIRINELERKTLAAQMNPHFIFNSLNTLQQLVLDQETEMALKYLGDFALLMRQILSNSRKPVIAIHEELEFLKNYIIVEKVRYYGAFNFEFLVEGGLDEMITLPPMLIQPIVENAIKYGVSTATNVFPLIVISVQQKESFLVFEITDNGAGIDYVSNVQQERKPTSSNALEIIKERLNLIEIKKRKGSLELGCLDIERKTGTRVRIKIPI